MRTLVTPVAVAAALVLIAASGVMNFTFWSEQGRTPFEGQVFGAVSVAFDVFKAILPILIAAAWVARRWVYVALGSVAFGLFLISATVAAIGFTATSRGHATDSRDAQSARLTIAQRELAELDDKASRITGYPPIGAIEAQIQALQQDNRWLSSKSCTDATLPKSRDFCAAYFAEQAKLSAAVEANRTDNRRAELRAEITQLRSAGAGEAADPQASLIARLLPSFDVSGVQLALVVFFALLVEFGASFGLFLATRHAPTPVAPKAPHLPVAEPVAMVLQPAPRRRALGHMAKPSAPEPRRFILDEKAEAFMSGQ